MAWTMVLALVLGPSTLRETRWMEVGPFESVEQCRQAVAEVVAPKPAGHAFGWCVPRPTSDEGS